MSRIWISHATHMDEKCVTYEKRYVTHMKESGRVMPHICVWVTSHIWMIYVIHMNGYRHITHINESRVTYEWVISHIWRSHVTYMNQSCHTYEWVMLQISTSQVTYTNELTMSIGSFRNQWMYHALLLCVAVGCSVLQCVAVCCSVLQCVAVRCMYHTLSHCSPLQHRATQSNTLQHTATHCNTLQHTAELNDIEARGT